MNMINLYFKDYDEMEAFCRRVVQTTPTEPVKQEPVKKEEPLPEILNPTEPEETPLPFQEEEPKAEEAPKKEEAPAYTMADVRKFLGDLRKAGKKDEVTELIRSFGVEKFTEIPEDKYAEVMEKAREL